MTDTLFLDTFKLYGYHLPLNQAMLVKGRQDTIRSGLVIELHGSKRENKIIALGEIAPLPGLHSETTEECISFLKHWFQHDFKIWQQTSDSLTELKKRIIQTPYPAIQWGLNTAILNLHAIQSNCLAAEVLSASIPQHIELNALLGGSLDDILKTASNKQELGYTCFKLKVGQQTIREEIEKVIQLRLLLGKNAKIRLDANQQWTLANAIKFGKAIGNENIEYIEEPTQYYAEFNHFFEETGISVALDESLIKFKSSLFKTQTLLHPGIRALIIKPSLWGNLQEIIHLKTAQQNIVISSCFESGLGISHLAQIAASICPSVAVGLDTYHWLKQDILVEPLDLHHSQLNLRQTWQRSQILDKNLLQEISLKD